MKGSECAASCFILGDIFVGNKLQVQFVSNVLVVMKDHQMVQPCLGHRAPKVGFDATEDLSEVALVAGRISSS